MGDLVPRLSVVARPDDVDAVVVQDRRVQPPGLVLGEDPTVPEDDAYVASVRPHGVPRGPVVAGAVAARSVADPEVFAVAVGEDEGLGASGDPGRRRVGGIKEPEVRPEVGFRGLRSRWGRGCRVDLSIRRRGGAPSCRYRY